jgi:hypothetical protein
MLELSWSISNLRAKVYAELLLRLPTIYVPIWQATTLS